MIFKRHVNVMHLKGWKKWKTETQSIRDVRKTETFSFQLELDSTKFNNPISPQKNSKTQFNILTRLIDKTLGQIKMYVEVIENPW